MGAGSRRGNSRGWRKQYSYKTVERASYDGDMQARLQRSELARCKMHDAMLAEDAPALIPRMQLESHRSGEPVRLCSAENQGQARRWVYNPEHDFLASTLQSADTSEQNESQQNKHNGLFKC